MGVFAGEGADMRDESVFFTGGCKLIVSKRGKTVEYYYYEILK